MKDLTKTARERAVNSYYGPVTTATPWVFAEALVAIRTRFGCADWSSFSAAVKSASGVVVPTGSIQHYAPNYRRTSGPSADMLWLLESAGVLEFANGEPVTAAGLIDVFYGRRDANGNKLR